MKTRILLPALLISLFVAGWASAQRPTTKLIRVPADERPRLQSAFGTPASNGASGLRYVEEQATPQRGTPERIYYGGAIYQRVEVAPPASTGRLVRVGTYSPFAPASFSTVPPTYTMRPNTTGPMPTGYQYGRGLIGQPKLYVPGQPLRNFFRYITP